LRNHQNLERITDDKKSGEGEIRTQAPLAKSALALSKRPILKELLAQLLAAESREFRACGGAGAAMILPALANRPARTAGAPARQLPA
jgi:hypothetical protein